MVYGHKKDTLHISVDSERLIELLHENTHVVEIKVDADTEACLIKDVQWDHLGSDIIHVDLARVNLSETVTVSVELQYTGEAIGLKEDHTVLDHPQSTIEVECRVDQIPEAIVADVSALEVNQTLTVAELQLPAGVKCTLPGETVLAAVRIIMPVEEEEEEVEAVEGEPEVIGRDKEEGEEAPAEESSGE